MQSNSGLYMTYMSIQMIVSGFTLDTLGDNNWVCYSFEYVPDQILFPVPDTPVPQVKYYLQYQSHQSNDISSTRHTKPECQILFPVPVTPVKWYFKYQSHQPNIISGTFSPAKYYFQYQTHQQSHQQPKQPQQQGQTQFKSGHMEVTIFIFVIIKVTPV